MSVTHSRRWLVVQCLRWLLAASLISTAVAKLLEQPSAVSMPPWLYWTAIGFEVLGAALLIGGRIRAGAAVVLGLALGGIVYSLIDRSTGCGCLGKLFVMSRAHHRLLASAFGSLAVVEMMLCPPPHPGTTTQSSAPAAAP